MLRDSGWRRSWRNADLTSILLYTLPHNFDSSSAVMGGFSQYLTVWTSEVHIRTDLSVFLSEHCEGTHPLRRIDAFNDACLQPALQLCRDLLFH